MGIGRGNHPNSRKNLKQFEPGGVYNPKGSSAKVRERQDAKAQIEAMRQKYKLEGYEPFSTEARRVYFEFLRSLPPSEFVKVASDHDLPIAAVIDAKTLKTDFSEGTSANTDRIERQIYGNKGNVNVSGNINGGLSLDSIGFVFGGEDVEDEE